MQEFDFLIQTVTMFQSLCITFGEDFNIFSRKVWWVYRMLFPSPLFCPFSAFFNHSKWINHLSRDLQSRQSPSTAAVTQKTLVSLIPKFTRRSDTEWRYQKRTFSKVLFPSLFLISQTIIMKIYSIIKILNIHDI